MDARLRQLERLLRSGDPALLRERLRAGMLSPDDLWLAAHLGHAGARELLGEEAPPVRRELREWVDELAGRGLALRVGLAAVRAASPLYEAGRPGDRRAAEALAAIDRWHTGLDLGPAQLDALMLAVMRSREAAREAGHGPPHWAAMAIHYLACATWEPTQGPLQSFTWAAIDAAVRALGGEEEVRAAIALALLPEGLRDLAA